MKTGIELIAIERQEQIEKHKRTIGGDVKWNADCQLSNAAALLMYVDPEELDGGSNEDGTYDFKHCTPVGWLEFLFNKMMNKPYKERLIIAGALIAAEIDRLQKQENPLMYKPS